MNEVNKMVNTHNLIDKLRYIGNVEDNYLIINIDSLKMLEDHIINQPTYYVIKNKQTGEYYRGKGVNKWGKYFNQASIYRIKGSAEFSMKELLMRDDDVEIVEISILEHPNIIS